MCRLLCAARSTRLKASIGWVGCAFDRARDAQKKRNLPINAMCKFQVREILCRGDTHEAEKKVSAFVNCVQTLASVDLCNTLPRLDRLKFCTKALLPCRGIALQDFSYLAFGDSTESLTWATSAHTPTYNLLTIIFSITTAIFRIPMQITI